MARQVRETSKILCRMSTMDCQFKRMIDKFLWINLHEKPILNAMGFFVISRKSVFQCLAFIISIMLVLVQFKEMESVTDNQS
ncbi:gustatory and pheromone receptor 39a [Musca domestica]|uniref:Gustatory and pheromone receptor 39a n=1 Tax=Musca domestica TaxID=7370 RepID=A0A9J7DN12_MUSDO|nr:gustatory and pheromone receptor 39a [Musca domestica]